MPTSEWTALRLLLNQTQQLYWRFFHNSIWWIFYVSFNQGRLVLSASSSRRSEKLRQGHALRAGCFKQGIRTEMLGKHLRLHRLIFFRLVSMFLQDCFRSLSLTYFCINVSSGVLLLSFCSNWGNFQTAVYMLPFLACRYNIRNFLLKAGRRRGVKVFVDQLVILLVIFCFSCC